MLRFIYLFLLISNSTQGAWLVQGDFQSHKKASLRISHLKDVAEPKAEYLKLRSLPYYLLEHDKPSKQIYEERIYPENALPKILHTFKAEDKYSFTNSEVRTLREQGPTQNRINLTILGDGYTEAERQKFFADAQRITNDLFTVSTFASYLPLFNVFAVFVASEQSGVTDGSDRRNTAFGLYRSPAGSKRAIMPGNERKIDQALALAPKTDYPILIANDDYYGGLGGKYAITTRSLTSGSMVLRHELGHNFGNVGEEYDGGYSYFGANSSSTSRVPWAHWLETDLKVNRYQQISGDYVWQNLSQSYKRTFNFPGSNSILGLELSSVGWAKPEEVSIFLDDKKIAYNGVFTVDRSFFQITRQSSLTAGQHSIKVSEQIKDGDNILAFANIYAYESDYDFSEDKIDAFTTINNWGRTSYRPTHESCLMRNMRIKKFCSVDIENMWQRFLRRVSLIDELSINEEGLIELKVPRLQGLSVKWFLNEEELIEQRDQYRWSAHQLKGSLRAEVSFKTKEVRNYTNDFSDQARLQLN